MKTKYFNVTPFVLCYCDFYNKKEAKAFCRHIGNKTFTKCYLNRQIIETPIGLIVFNSV